jgi:Acetyltransferases
VTWSRDAAAEAKAIHTCILMFCCVIVRLPPDGAEMLQLKPEHAKAIHDLYPANDMECVEVFEKLINALPAYGIFSSGELAAWMVQSYYGAMFSMQTRPEFRRKGYGIYLAQYLTKVVISRGYIPFVVIRPENDASLSLYNKLGFKKHYQTVRCILRPHGYDDTPQGGENAAPSDN